jgi:hypothetical protein
MTIIKQNIDDKIYRDYSLFLMRELSQIVDKGVGIDISIYPCSDAGNTIVEITFNKENRSSYRIYDKIGLKKGLLKTQVDKFTPMLTGVRFEGTNTFVGSDSIVYIKENDEDLFTEEAVVENMLTLVKYRLGKE